ncbi:MAG: hypothetical protein UW52_C0073G0006 [Candidatus Gottesmanbacteria bacterium GW2011_GWA1_44_24b]|uniref:Lipoprotein n=1 Tax=Candidatus Gottesmanbacteria bacterium GW2011_GWA1_44_24b TaxID=1618437 RepID=A0A0G1IDT5_9BACT|nr:MAG: hypothetical protein UW52_C0073G0006 [Candidatus Gottesmanbacteria bacterium GW2011_GWA1_44_24b]
MKKLWFVTIISVLSALMLTSCVSYGKVFTQTCPIWSGMEGECLIQQAFTWERSTLAMTDWSVARLDIAGKMLINRPENVTFYQEDGAEIDTDKNILSGVVVVRRNSQAASLFEVNPTPSGFSVCIQFVRQQQ